MAKTCKFQLKSKTSRKDLAAHNDPYFELIHPGLHLGFRRAPNTRGETWSLRTRIGKKYTHESLGAVKDEFDYKQAKAKAVEREEELKQGDDPNAIKAAYTMTVSDLVRLYIEKHASVKKNPDWERLSTRERITRYLSEILDASCCPIYPRSTSVLCSWNYAARWGRILLPVARLYCEPH